MLEVLAYAVMLPFAVLFDVLHWVGRWRMFVRQQQPREAELLRASHGAAVLVLAGLALYAVGPADINRFLAALRATPDDPLHLVPALAFAGVMLWGLLWFVSGVRRSLAWAGFRDSRLMTLALVKIALGVGLWLAFWHPPASWSASIGALRSVPFSSFAVVVVAAWMVTTGLVKLVLVVWPRFSSAKGDVMDDIEGQDFDWDK